MVPNGRMVSYGRMVPVIVSLYMGHVPESVEHTEGIVRPVAAMSTTVERREAIQMIETAGPVHEARQRVATKTSAPTTRRRVA